MVYGVFDRGNLLSVQLLPELANKEKRSFISMIPLPPMRAGNDSELKQYQRRIAEFSVRVAATKKGPNWYNLDDPDLEAKIAVDMQPKKMGRPRIEPDEHRVTVNFTSTVTLALSLQAEAAKAGLSLSRYCNNLLDSHPDRKKVNISC